MSNDRASYRARPERRRRLRSPPRASEAAWPSDRRFKGTDVLTFVLANALVLTGAALAVGELRLGGALDRVIAFFTLAFAQIVATLLFAGVVLRRLEPGVVLGLNVAVAAVLLGLRIRRTGLAYERAPSLLPRRRLDASLVLQSPWLAALLALAGAQAIWRIFAAWVLPPSGFDALWYHLTTVGWWLQSSRIDGNPLVLWSDVYPSDGELLFTWPGLFLRSDTFVDAAQLPLAVLGALAVAGIARTVGLSAKSAAAAGALFFLSPIVLVEASAAYVDLVFASSFLVGLHFLARAFAERPVDRRMLFLAGVGGGLALGSKYVGGLYCAVLAVSLFAWLVRRQTPPRVAAIALLVFLLPMLALGSYWYIRNWLNHGSPVYPYGQQPLRPYLSGPAGCQGLCLGDVLHQWHQDHVPWVSFHRFHVDLARGGLGPLWSYVAAPLAAFVLVHALFRSPQLLWSLFLPVLAAVALQPYRWWSRFTIVLLAVGTVAVVYVLERLPPRLAGATKILCLALVILGLSYSTPATSVFDAVGKPSSERTSASVSPPWFAWVDRLGDGSRIAADTSTEAGPGAGALIWYFFPLFGDRFQHRVFPLTGRSDSAIARGLISVNAGYVIVGNRGPYAPFMQRAADERCLSPIYRDETASAYRVRPSCLERLFV
jgi:hypothetical protein